MISEIDKLNTKIQELEIELEKRDDAIKQKDEDMDRLVKACERVQTETLKLVDAYNKTKEYLRQAQETLQDMFKKNFSVN